MRPVFIETFLGGELHCAAQFVSTAARRLICAYPTFENLRNLCLQRANFLNHPLFLRRCHSRLHSKREHVDVHQCSPSWLFLQFVQRTKHFPAMHGEIHAHPSLANYALRINQKCMARRKFGYSQIHNRSIFFRYFALWCRRVNGNSSPLSYRTLYAFFHSACSRRESRRRAFRIRWRRAENSAPRSCSHS